MHNELIPFTLYLDMLGYSNKVGKIKNQNDAKKFIEFMKSNKGIFDIISNRLDITHDFLNYYEFKYSFISDSIIISLYPKKLKESVSEKEYYKYSALFFMDLCNKILPLFFNIWNHEKILIRGGISNKFTYIENEFAVGEGLIEAYKLESEEALYPRIVISRSLSNNKQFMQSLQEKYITIYGKGEYILKKDKGDDLFYIDYLNLLKNQENPKFQYFENIRKSNEKFFSLHKKAIDEMKLFLESKKDTDDYENVKKKYDWIKQYHNSNLNQKYQIK